MEPPGADVPSCRYHRFRDYLLRRYGKRIQKIPLDAGFGCPHRGGPDQRGGTGCVYCANVSFSPHSRAKGPPLPLAEQLERGINHGRKRYGAEGFIAYFQAYTNTYAPPDVLRERYSVIRRFPEIVDLAVGTRPDCVDEPVLDVLESFRSNYDVWVEYGLQSAHDATLTRIRRGHTVGDFLDAVERTSRRRLAICVHVILGLPGEGPGEIMETARLLAGLPIQGVKIHHCHVVRGTPLAEDYLRGAYRPPERSQYIEWVCDFLELLPWSITIQRLVGDAPRDLLLAPAWGSEKGEVLRRIEEELERRESRQGKKAPTPGGVGDPGRPRPPRPDKDWPSAREEEGRQVAPTSRPKDGTR